jgi:hypothetical protein
MEVTFHSSSRAFTQVKSHVESFRPINFPESLFAFGGQFNHFLPFLEGCFGKISDMAIKDDEQMTGSVGETIQNDKAVTGTLEDEVISVLLYFIPKDVAKNTAWLLRTLTNVMKTPRCPEMIHSGINQLS